MRAKAKGERGREDGELGVDLDLEDLSPSKSKSDLDDNILSEVYARGRWLVGLLVLQSSSSFVLDRYQDLLKEHLVSETAGTTLFFAKPAQLSSPSSLRCVQTYSRKLLTLSYSSSVTGLIH